MEPTTESYNPSDLSSGYKLVPWSSWSQWLSVHDSIFSSNPAAALRKVSAWRSRGCIPVPVDITAAIVEIQQKDPEFRDGGGDGELGSEELLAMLYCMSVMRLVNGFVEPAHKKTGRSISELADAVGIPRMVVDIRHESSHRNLPSLRLARLAGMKALEWLKWNYWDPQKNAIPDIQKETRARLQELMYFLKIKHTQKIRSSQTNGKGLGSCAILKGRNTLSSQIMGKRHSRKSDGTEKQISRISKTIARLYSAYPSEVVLALLEYFQLQEPDVSKCINSEQYDKLDNEQDREQISVTGSTHYFKTIVAKLCSIRPRLLLSVLKTVLEIIEKERGIYETSEFNLVSLQNEAVMCYIKNLCSLVAWLLMKLKALKDSGQIRLSDGNHEPSTDKNAAPRVALIELLNKCLKLSSQGNKHISYSVLLIAEMIGNHRLTEKLNNLPLLLFEDQDSKNDHASPDAESSTLYEEDAIGKAEEQLELLKSRLRCRHIGSPSPVDDAIWKVARSWIHCPIGMLPCSFTSTAVLPVLDRECEGLQSKEMETQDEKAEVGCASETCDPVCDEDYMEIGCAPEMCELVHGEDYTEDGTPLKKLKHTLEEEQMLDFPETEAPMAGCLLIGGHRKQVAEEELLSIESKMLQFMSTTVDHLRTRNPE